MALRTNWKFEYPCSQVAEAAKRKLDFHRDRERYWGEEVDKAFDALKDSVQVRETPLVRNNNRGMSAMASAEVYAVSAPRNTNRDIDIAADPAAERHLENCRYKHQQHKSTADDFLGYYTALSANPNEVVQLDVQDINHFGIGGWKPEDEGEEA